MSDTPSQATGKSIMPAWIKGPQDFVGGVALMALALFALWASRDLQGMHGFSFGAGTAPRMFAVLLLALGVGVTVIGVLSEGTAPRSSITGAVPCSSRSRSCRLPCTIRPLGLDLLGLGELHDRGAADQPRRAGSKP